LPRFRTLRPELDLPPAYGAALIQLTATVSAIAQAMWLTKAGVELTAMQWAGLQGCTACALAVFLRSASWWRVIHLLFAPALVLGLALEVPPAVCFGVLLALVVVYWGCHRSQVPLYLSGPAAWREVLALLPPNPGTRVVDLGSGLGGLAAFIGRARPDARVDGIEAAPLPFVLGSMRKRLNAWNGDLWWGDMWKLNLAGYDVVHAYLSPVPMPALWQKACREMRPGGLLISHSFAVPGVAPVLVRALPGGNSLYVFRVGG
jgi:SAM-dependent methyltransferase